VMDITVFFPSFLHRVPFHSFLSVFLGCANHVRSSTCAAAFFRYFHFIRRQLPSARQNWLSAHN